MRRCCVLFILLALILTPRGFSQNFNITDFAGNSFVVVRGNATLASPSLMLTSAGVGEVSAAWFGAPLGVVTGFDTQFDFRITPGPSGVTAEGLAFIVQNDPLGSQFLGGPQLGPGYTGGAHVIANSVVIEIDTAFQPLAGDTCGNEISVHSGGVGGNSISESASLGNVCPQVSMSDGQVHTFRVVYVPGTLDIFLDNLAQPVLSIPYDFTTGGNLLSSAPVGGLDLIDGTSAIVGFTAATGTAGATETTEILSWSWMSTGGPPTCFQGNVGASTGFAESVLTVNGEHGGFLHRVQVPTFQPLTIDVAQPSVMGLPSAFLLFGFVGEADGSSGVSLPIGDFCFPAAVPVSPPGSYLIANSFGIPAPALVPSTPTPWTLTLPGGFPFETTATYQAVIQDITAPFGLAITNAVIVDFVTAPPPVIQSVFPESPSPGGLVTLVGENFFTNYQIAVDGIAVTPVLVSADSVVFVYPAGVSCDAMLTITRSDGQSASTTLNPSPVIANVVGDSGSSLGGQNVILQGSGFVPGSTLTIGGAPATVVSITDFAIVALTPPGSVGVVPIFLTTPNGCTATASYTYF